MENSKIIFLSMVRVMFQVSLIPLSWRKNIKNFSIFASLLKVAHYLYIEKVEKITH